MAYSSNDMSVRIIYEVKMEMPRLAESAFGDDLRQGTLAMRRTVVAPWERSRTADHHCASPEIAVVRSTARMPTRSMLRRGPSNSVAAASAKARSAMACKLGTAARSSLSASSYSELAIVFLFVYMRRLLSLRRRADVRSVQEGGAVYLLRRASTLAWCDRPYRVAGR